MLRLQAIELASFASLSLVILSILWCLFNWRLNRQGGQGKQGARLEGFSCLRTFSAVAVVPKVVALGVEDLH
ncbi:MAG: hypothetical protein N2235_02130 [Fischerella sp.]|nr:hypothetical protein [Fischerella sp.]